MHILVPNAFATYIGFFSSLASFDAIKGWMYGDLGVLVLQTQSLDLGKWFLCWYMYELFINDLVDLISV